MDKKFIILIKEDERRIKEDEYLLQQNLVETKMKERRLRLKKDKYLCFKTFVVIAIFLVLGVICFAAIQFCFGQNEITDDPFHDPKHYLNTETNGIRKSRPNRDHDIVSAGRPFINEFVTPFFGFFKDSNTNAENYDATAKKFVQNPPNMEFFEIEKDNEYVDEDYALIIIEKNHKKTGESVILQYSKFNKQCFGTSNYCSIGNGSVNQMTYLNFNKFKQTFDEEEEEIDGLSTDFLLLIIKNVEEFEDEWEIEKINNVKYFVSAYMKNFFKYNTVNAAFVGKFDGNDKDWIIKMKNKFNLRDIPFTNSLNKTTSLCGDSWKVKTVPTPRKQNICSEFAADAKDEHDYAPKFKMDESECFPLRVTTSCYGPSNLSFSTNGKYKREYIQTGYKKLHTCPINGLPPCRLQKESSGFGVGTQVQYSANKYGMLIDLDKEKQIVFVKSPEHGIGPSSKLDFEKFMQLNPQFIESEQQYCSIKVVEDSINPNDANFTTLKLPIKKGLLVNIKTEDGTTIYAYVANNYERGDTRIKTAWFDKDKKMQKDVSVYDLIAQNPHLTLDAQPPPEPPLSNFLIDKITKNVLQEIGNRYRENRISSFKPLVDEQMNDMLLLNIHISDTMQSTAYMDSKYYQFYHKNDDKQISANDVSSFIKNWDDFDRPNTFLFPIWDGPTWIGYGCKLIEEKCWFYNPSRNDNDKKFQEATKILRFVLTSKGIDLSNFDFCIFKAETKGVVMDGQFYGISLINFFDQFLFKNKVEEGNNYFDNEKKRKDIQKLMEFVETSFSTKNLLLRALMEVKILDSRNKQFNGVVASYSMDSVRVAAVEGCSNCDNDYSITDIIQWNDHITIQSFDKTESTSDNYSTNLDFYVACQQVELQYWDDEDGAEKKGNETSRLKRQSPGNPLKVLNQAQNVKECKSNWKMQLKVGDRINFEIKGSKNQASGIITNIINSDNRRPDYDPKNPISGFTVDSSVFGNEYDTGFGFVSTKKVRSRAADISSIAKKTTAVCVASKKKSNQKRCNDGSDLGECSPEKIIQLDTSECKSGSDVTYFDKTGTKRTRRIVSVSSQKNRIEELIAICNFKGTGKDIAKAIVTLKEVHIQSCGPATSLQIECPYDAPLVFQNTPLLAFDSVNDRNFIISDNGECETEANNILSNENHNQDIDRSDDTIDDFDNDLFGGTSAKSTSSTIESLPFSYEGVEFLKLDTSENFVSTPLSEFLPVPDSPSDEQAADYVQKILNIIFPTTDAQRSFYTYIIIPANIEPGNVKLTDVLYVGSSNNFCRRFFNEHIYTKFKDYIAKNGAIKVLVFMESNVSQSLQYESLLLFFNKEIGLVNLINERQSSWYASVFEEMKWMENHPLREIFIQGLRHLAITALQREGLKSDSALGLSQCAQYFRNVKSIRAVNILPVEADIPPEQVIPKMDKILSSIFPTTIYQRKCVSYVILPKGLLSNFEKFKFTTYVGRSIDFITKFYLHFWRGDFLENPPEEGEWVVVKFYEGHIATCYEIEALFQRVYDRMGIPTMANKVIEPLVSYKIFEGASVNSNLLKLVVSYLQQLLHNAFESSTEISKDDALQFLTFKRQEFLRVLKIINPDVHQNFREKAAAASKLWRDEHREQEAARLKSWRDEHREQEAARLKLWRKNNPEKIKLWRKPTPEEKRQYYINRKLRSRIC